MTDSDQLTAELLNEMVKARKSKRRKFWLKLILFSIIGLVLIGSLFGKKDVAIFKPHVALVQIKGVIGEGQDVEAQLVIEALQSAIDSDLSSGVIIEINSPGGSPVQSALIYDEINRLRTRNPEKKIHCLVTDLAASGGYYVASACENIYANRASLVGSIGVVLSGIAGFGFTKAMENLGIERRMMTAGKHKGFLDPFSPLGIAEQTHTQNMLDNLHQEFITDVKKGRGARLKDNQEIFTGFIWSAKRALELGLIDEFSNRAKLAKDAFDKTDIYDYTPKKDPFEELLAFSKALLGNLKFLGILSGT